MMFTLSGKDHNFDASLHKYVIIADLFAVFGICFWFNFVCVLGNDLLFV